MEPISANFQSQGFKSFSLCPSCGGTLHCGSGVWGPGSYSNPTFNLLPPVPPLSLQGPPWPGPFLIWPSSNPSHSRRTLPGPPSCALRGLILLSLGPGHNHYYQAAICWWGRRLCLVNGPLYFQAPLHSRPPFFLQVLCLQLSLPGGQICQNSTPAHNSNVIWSSSPLC